MLSIRNNITELERLAAERDTAVDCYRDVLHNVANYAVELDDQVTSQHRRYVTAVAEGLTSTAESLREAGATLRALCRDYRAKAAEYLNNIREQLASTARALEEVMESLAQTDGDCETRMRSALGGLRELAQQPALRSGCALPRMAVRYAARSPQWHPARSQAAHSNRCPPPFLPEPVHRCRAAWIRCVPGPLRLDGRSR